MRSLWEIDSTYKSSNWNPEELQVTGEGLYGEWRSICLTEIHRRYPEYTIMTLEHAKWVEWTGENDKEKKKISHESLCFYRSRYSPA